MPKRRIVALLALALAAAPAAAWGPTGHRVTGAIAERHLEPRARDAVRAILGSETIAEASTWPDFMRSDPSEFWRTTASPWHYVTVPDGKTYAEVGAPPQGDAVSALARFAATLRDPGASLADKRLALRFAIHIIGDLHQPLHVGNGLDRGGNDVKVTWFGRETNLHAVWDADIVDDQKLSYSEMAAWLGDKIMAEQAHAWNTADPLVWIGESQAVRAQVYPPKPDLRWDYGFQHKALLDQRLSQAGVRVAAWVNAVFAPPAR